jgi:hypothetical protein
MSDHGSSARGGDDDLERTVFESPEGEWCLRGVSGEHFGSVLNLTHEVFIGRAPDCDLVIDSPKVSRHHARVARAGGAVFVEDLESSNGTRVNGERISKAVLKDGDQIEIGRERFMVYRRGSVSGFRRPAAPDPGPPAPAAKSEPAGPPAAASGPAWAIVVGVAVVLALAAGVVIFLAWV